MRESSPTMSVKGEDVIKGEDVSDPLSSINKLSTEEIRSIVTCESSVSVNP